MEGSVATCPNWLEKRIDEAGGSISFSQFMDWSLNDPEHGAYGSGRLRIGKKGDFVTSPSLGPEFAELLAIQLVDWLKQLEKKLSNNQTLSLIDIGPGEGDLAKDLIISIHNSCPEICKKLNLILVEENDGMARRQKTNLKTISFVNIYWKSLKELEDSPVYGVVIANELLDALPVERIIYRNKCLYQQGVSIVKKGDDSILTFIDLPLSEEIIYSLEETCNSRDLNIPPIGISDGWSSEWHVGLDDWFSRTSRIINIGALLIIDYSLDAKSYYNPSRSSGTLLAYRNNTSSSDILRDPGHWDLTAHLCFETLDFYSKKNNFRFLGKVPQGQALLSLGLADKLYDLNSLTSNQISYALNKRENLLRLIEPSGLGGFLWIAYEIDNYNRYSNIKLDSLFLKEPIN